MRIRGGSVQTLIDDRDAAAHETRNLAPRLTTVLPGRSRLSSLRMSWVKEPAPPLAKMASLWSDTDVERSQ